MSTVETNWIIIENNIVVDSIIADSKSIVEELFPGKIIIQDDGIIGVGWKNFDGVWKSPRPEDNGFEYEWNDELHTWTQKLPENVPLD
jgi:hypothetical protein